MPLEDLRIVTPLGESESRALLSSIGVDPYGIEAMVPKMRHVNILVKKVPCRDGNIIKQEMLALGGDAAVSRGTVGCTDRETDVLIMGTEKQIRRFIEKMKRQPGHLKMLADTMMEALCRYETEEYIWQTARREILLGKRTLIMGILNCTPDSFSDGGKYREKNRAIERAFEMVEEGADLVDVGGESSRPGADPVTAEEEMRRTIPVIEEMADRLPVPISIDTTKASVARAALEAGAEIVNDISALTLDEEMVKVVAEKKAGVVLMHMRGRPQTMQAGEITYEDVVGDIVSYLRARFEVLRRAGIDPEQVACDPGIGFGKTVEHNYTLLRRLLEFRVLGRPIVIGVSRKSLIGAVTGEGPEGRLEGTAAAVTAAVLGGAAIVRVHDVKEMKKVVAVADAVRHGLKG
ncbi:MAG TPA: dihydropteroate synthase [Syntrophales bacterium]|nr:dihydropteroate synthase [Syntrophales bacterium]HOL59739.1 dihydropteroate synthase [Syntrophales bacterium]HPO35885.1 dihydropteroate synthase [Syntrophales bacterium]